MSDKVFGCLILFLLIVGFALVGCAGNYAVVHKGDNFPCKPPCVKDGRTYCAVDKDKRC